jgi:hypothetical protein
VLLAESVPFSAMLTASDGREVLWPNAMPDE